MRSRVVLFPFRQIMVHDAVWCQAGLSATDFACQRLLSHEGSTKQQMDFQPHTGYC